MRNLNPKPSKSDKIFSSQYLLRKYVDISGQTGWKNPRNGLWARPDSLIFKYVEYYKYHPPALEQRDTGAQTEEKDRESEIEM